MTRVVLRRAEDQAASPDEASRLVIACHGSIVDQSGRTMLVEVEDDAAVEQLRDQLRGWVISPQGPKIPVPDTRLKVRSQR